VQKITAGKNVSSEKVQSEKVFFTRLILHSPGNLPQSMYDLVTFSLVLEHIENLNFVFSQAAQVVKTGGYCYVGELHPFKQYLGTRARFETGAGVQVLTCFTHNISDFVQAAKEPWIRNS
jgi:2-polyprenyl-3-methyl-5-hydroxy-6-metoxy-1,4-benzoquinol methylase